MRFIDYLIFKVEEHIQYNLNNDISLKLKLHRFLNGINSFSNWS